MAEEQGQFSRELELQPEPELAELASDQSTPAIEEEATQELQTEALEEQEQIQEAEELEAIRQEEGGLLENEVNSIKQEAQTFGSPSFIKYFIIIVMLAIPNDLVDALDLTGFGAIAAWFISIGLSATSIIFCWFTDQEQKRAEGYMKRLDALKARVASSSRTIFRVVKLFKKNPMVKIGVGVVAEMIPYLDIFPWATVAAIWAYYDERSMYKHAQKSGQEVSSEDIEMV